MTVLEIRDDLKNIRYYYARQKVFDSAQQNVGKNAILDKIDLYNNIICSAPPKLYDLYVSLYLGNHTQESLSEKLGYSIEYISRLNSKLIKFFQKEFLKKEEVQNV